MRILSLFDGISCGRLALSRSGIKVDAYYASEVDKYAIQIANKNFPDTIQLGDIKNVHYSDGILYSDNGEFDVGVIDLIIGGSPCQSFTFAGKRSGMSTSDNIEILSLEDYLKYKESGFTFSGQSYLFWEYVRILREVNPKYFLLENVKMEKKWESVISSALGVSPFRINSNLFSAQNRDRLYWTNITKSVDLPESNPVVLKDILIDSVDVFKYQLSKKHHEGFLRNYPSWKPCDIDKKSKPLLASYYKQPPHCPYIKSEKTESGYRRLCPIECERLQTLPDDYTEGVSDTQRYKTIGNCWTVDTVSCLFNYIH